MGLARVFNFSILNEKNVRTPIELKYPSFRSIQIFYSFLVSCFRHYFLLEERHSVAPVEELKPQTPKDLPFAFPRRRPMTLFRNFETK